MGAGLDLRYLGSFQLCERQACSPIAAASDIDAWYGLDLHGGYTFNRWRGRPALAVGVNNVLDLAPPVRYVAGQSGVSQSTYDVVGRFFSLQLSSRF